MQIFGAKIEDKFNPTDVDHIKRLEYAILRNLMLNFKNENEEYDFSSSLPTAYYVDIHSLINGRNDSVDENESTAIYSDLDLGWYSTTSSADTIVTKRVMNLASTIERIVVQELTNQSENVVCNTYDISFDDGVSWSTGHSVYSGLATDFSGTSYYSGDTCRLKIRFNIDLYSGWSTAGALNTEREYTSSCGNSLYSLCIGGFNTSGRLNTCEKNLGSSWTTTSNLSGSARNSIGSCGYTSSALAVGGTTGAAVDTVEKWNGSSWATTTSSLKSSYNVNCSGNTSSCLAFDGDTSSNSTVKWDGSSWTSVSNPNVDRDTLSSVGNSEFCLSIGGDSGVEESCNTVEKWSNYFWATTSSLIADRHNHSSFGTYEKAICCGGINDTTLLSTSERFIDYFWATTSSLGTETRSLESVGSTATGVVFGGSTTAVGNTTGAVSTTNKFSHPLQYGFALKVDYTLT